MSNYEKQRISSKVFTEPFYMKTKMVAEAEASEMLSSEIDT